MDFFNKFLDKVEYIRPKYMFPLFFSISVALTNLLAPFFPDSYYHEFKKPSECDYSGETLEITSDYKIVVGDDASASDLKAAEILKNYLYEIGATELEIVEDTVAESDKEIIVGKTNREGEDYTIDRTNLGDDGIVIKTVGERIVLSGAEKRGVIYSVYNFLKEYFDCRWFTKDLTVIPKSDSLKIPKSIDYTYTPALPYRANDSITIMDGGNTFCEFAVANGLNDQSWHKLPNEYGSGYSFLGSFSHSFHVLVDQSLFETEPELFALGVETGERTTDQLCLTNPRTLELAKQTVSKWLKSNPNADVVNVTQNDNLNYCVCENCKKIDDEEGSQSGTMLRFVNAIADDIKDDYPDVLVGTFAYTYTRVPPKITVPRENVMIRLCSFECDFSTPLNSGFSKKNEKFKNELLQWRELTDNLFVWDYIEYFGNYLAPFGNFDVLQENIKFFIENGVDGLFEESNLAADAIGEFQALKAYMVSNLLWNPDCDVDELVYEFCDAYYGDGAQHIIDFINYVDKNSGGLTVDVRNWWILPIPNRIDIQYGVGLFTSPDSVSVLRASDKQIKEIDSWWQAAKDGARNEWQLKNIEQSEICWRYWKACVCKGEFSRKDEERRIEENKKLYEDFQRFGIIRLSCDNTEFIVENPDFSSVPHRWEDS